MKAVELFHMLGDINVYNNNEFSKYKVVTKDGRTVTGVQVDHEAKHIIIVTKNAWVEQDKTLITIEDVSDG